MKGKLKGIRGEVLTFKADPFVCGAAECYDHYEDGLVVMSAIMPPRLPHGRN